MDRPERHCDNLFVATKKRAALKSINEKLTEEFTRRGDFLEFKSDLLEARTYILGISTFPYSKWAGRMVNVLRLAPVGVAILRLVASP